MALMKTNTLANGATASYHRISRVTLVNNMLFCSLSSYTSKDYRDAEQELDSSSYSFFVSVEEEESMGIRQLTYKKLKELPEWEGAEDC